MKITQNSVLLRLSFSRAGNDRKVSLTSVKTEADKKRLRMTKKLFVCKEYKAIQSFDNALSEWVDNRAIPCNMYRGIKLLPLGLLVPVEQRLSEAQTQREELITAFMQVYDQERTTAQDTMKEFFDPKHYPASSLVAEKFGIAWSYVTFEVPENLPAGMLKREQEKLEAKFSEMASDMRQALRETMESLLKALSDQLKTKDDGKKRRFYDSSIESLSEFLQLFSFRNVTNDKTLGELATKAEQLIAGASGQKIRKDNTLREEMAKRTDEVLAAVSELIKTEPKRKFSLDEDEF